LAGEACLDLGNALELDDVPLDGRLELNVNTGSCPVGGALYGLAWEWQGNAYQAQVDGPVSLPQVFPLVDPVTPDCSHVDERTQDQDRRPAQRVWRVAPSQKRPYAPAWVIGSLVHAALAAWRFPDERFAEWAASQARSHGITDAGQIGHAVRQSQTLLNRFREHDLCRTMEQAEKRLHEVPYSLMVDDSTVENGIIDALYCHDGQWHIVEFKTDRLRDEDDYERLLAEKDYENQGRRYRRAVKKLLGQDADLVLCLLNYQGSVRLETVTPS
jgi:ATP-dependent exoDNAse (exonuclease V) beta subunit